ncbi:hypothetical protein X975_02310, partial [Stegodyphus mimosarum]
MGASKSVSGCGSILKAGRGALFLTRILAPGLETAHQKEKKKASTVNKGSLQRRTPLYKSFLQRSRRRSVLRLARV